MCCLWHGSGANGKTTITAGITAAVGEHAVYVPDRVLLANPGDHPTELMTLRGARLALLEETPEARHLNVKRLKDVLGPPLMTARLIHHDSVEWAPTHSLFVSTNYRPRVEETDHGTWRRLALVSFPFTYRTDGERLTGPNDRRADPTLRADSVRGTTAATRRCWPGWWTAPAAGMPAAASCQRRRRPSPMTPADGATTPT